MADIKSLEIPKWGLSMEEGTIAQWLIQEGDSFKKGDDICEIETTKIVNVLEAPFDGTLQKILADVGDTLAVGKPIALCSEQALSAAEIAAFIQQSHSNASACVEEPQTLNETSPANVQVNDVQVQQVAVAEEIKPPQKNHRNAGIVIPNALHGYTDEFQGFITPHAKRLAALHDINLNHIQGSGRAGRISVADLSQAVQAAGGQWLESRAAQVADMLKKSKADDTYILATPLARRLAQNWGINLHDCRASGSRGRVCKVDVEARHALEQAAHGFAATTAQTIDMPSTTTQHMSAMRKAIATRLQRAKQDAPHFRLSCDLNMHALEQLRQDINQSTPEVKLSINDLLVKATAAALMQVPEVNVQYDAQKQEIIAFKNADIAIAVALEAGLITPIVKAANQKSLAQISNEIRDLATRAKTGQLTLDEFQGGSFSLSNLGMLGVSRFDAIINPPQAAILALGAVETRPIIQHEQVVAARLMTATLSCDHRVVDGALGAKFLQQLKRFVEQPALILL